ncbi:MAG: Sau3AI family type II restriction endonuclease [Actinomycetota bacterium]|nr:Sau3AI family type II restriction endonuclease [Actinomycetota bacterium]
MERDGTRLPYDKHDRESIVHYAMELRGSTLRESSDVEAISDIRRNKGSFGNAVERYYFMIENNSDSAPDFRETGLELKTTPLKRSKDGRLVSKERLVIGMIDYMEVVHETFETSHLMEKAEDILLISYLWEPDKDPLDYRIELVELVDLRGLPESDLLQIKADWETVVGKVRDGCAHEVSGADTLYLEACTKASSSKVRRNQPFSDIPAKPRAWALKASFMTAMSNRFIENMQAIGRGADEQGMTLLELVRKRFEPCFGCSEQELGERFGYVKEGRRQPKGLCALITRRILGVDDDAKIEEFEKAGIVPKSLRIRRSGMPKESMSFPRFDYFKLVETPFEDSDFAGYLNQKYLFVIYRENDDGAYLLADVAFWQMPEADLEEAERCYEDMRRRVASGRARDSIRSTENRCCHVRPHGRDSNDTLPTPQGDDVVKKSFWLNARYLKEEVARITAG